MNVVTMAAILAFSTSTILVAQTHDHGHAKQAKPGKKVEGEIQTLGRVVKVDFVQDEITITHEPIPSLDWPVMTMVFKVKDKKMLDRVRPGSKVDFNFVESGKDYVIVEIR